MKGEKGLVGGVGAKGNAGKIGPQGMRGIQGGKGETGRKGEKGDAMTLNWKQRVWNRYDTRNSGLVQVIPILFVIRIIDV